MVAPEGADTKVGTPWLSPRSGSDTIALNSMYSPGDTDSGKFSNATCAGASDKVIEVRPDSTALALSETTIDTSTTSLNTAR